MGRPKNKFVALCSIDDCQRVVLAKSFCQMHYARFKRTGDPNKRRCRANGEGGIGSNGYFLRTIDGKARGEHVLIAESALGRKMPPEAVVHHWNKIKTDNRNENLLICPDRGYHKLIHYRMRAFDESGNANNERCSHCKKWESPAKVIFRSTGRNKRKAPYHHECFIERMKGIAGVVRSVDDVVRLLEGK